MFIAKRTSQVTFMQPFPLAFIVHIKIHPIQFVKYYKTSKFHSYNFKQKVFNFCTTYIRDEAFSKLGPIAQGDSQGWVQYVAYPLGLIT